MADEKCVHYWDIATADGPTSMGRCYRCGAIEFFDNVIYADTWRTSVTSGPDDVGSIRWDSADTLV